MSLKSEEFEVQSLINQAYYYATHIAENESYIEYSKKAIDRADQIMRPHIHEVFKSYSIETLISIGEVALKVPEREELSMYYLDLFFKLITNDGQFYIRALILKATLQSLESDRLGLKADDNVENIQKAFGYVAEAIKLIAKNPETKKKYSFLIYNISVCVYNIIRPFFRKGWLKPFLQIIQEVDKLLEEAQEPDINWKTRFSWIFFNCMHDSEPKDALKIFDKLWDNSKKGGGVAFQETLLRHRIHFAKDNSGALSQITKEVDSAPAEQGLNHLFKLQQMKSGIIEDTHIENGLNTLIYAINPAILTNQETISNTKLTNILQERLAEAARVAINYNYYNTCNQILNFLKRIRQTTQKTYVWMEYSKAELLVKVSGNNIDPKTGIRLNIQQIRQQEIERRIEALKIMEKTMGTNKNLNDPDLIYEGCILIWNIGLPFINDTFKQYIYEPFLAACELLEEIHSPDHELRVNFHLQLAKIDLKENFKKKAYSHINRAMRLDYSIPVNMLEAPPKFGEDPANYQRVLDRYLLFMRQKIGKEESGDENELSEIISLIESAQSAKLESVRQQKLHQALKLLVNLRLPPYIYDQSKDLVTEEIEKEKLQYNLRQAEIYKRSKLLAGEIVKLAFEWKLNSFVHDAAERIINEEWDPSIHIEMIANQVEAYHIVSQAMIENLIDQNVEPAFEEFILINEERTFYEDYSEEEKNKLNQTKRDIVDCHIKALALASKVGQNWMIFNGAIYIWNNYLMTFKNPLNDTKLIPEIRKLLKEYFEAMKDSISDIEKKMMADYDLDSKIQVYGNIGIIYARLLEGASLFDDVLGVCETLLLAPLTPHTRKLVNSIKARVGTQAKGGKGGKATSKGGQQMGQNNNDQILFEVVNQLEIIQNNTNKAQTPKLVEECFKSLSEWKIRENDETDLELHAELWTRLSKLALNDKNTQMYKYSLSCVENTLSMLGSDVDMTSIPTNRLRWYSLAEYLYAETLCKMVNPETQEKDSQESILFHALKHSLEACHKGSKARNSQLVIDAAKQFWDITSVLKSSYANRRILIKPIFSVIHYLSIIKEENLNDPDLVVLLQNVLFQGCMENEEWSLGETAADMGLELVPSNFKKQIWSWKMIFMSKQGKDELSIMNNIKDCDPFLQAKVWLKMARTSNQITKQYIAFNNAIEVLKKEESVAIVTILIEFSEWLLRNKYEVSLVKENLLMAADILLEVELDLNMDDEDEEEDEAHGAHTIFSRSSRGKRSGFGGRSEHTGGRSRQKSKRDQLNVGLDSNNVSRLQKSSAQQQSRMNRASKRDAKTINTENQKLIVTQNDEETYTEKLNIKHFDQLFRIHSMLSILAESAEEQIQNSFDALFFIKKILEKTLLNLADLIQTSEKLANKSDDPKGVNSESSIEFSLPTTIEEWINYSFPKELIERIQNNSESNIFCKYAFEYPELTYHYLETIIGNFEALGLDVQNVMLLKFGCLFAEKLLSHEYMTIAANLRFARCIISLGYAKEGKAIFEENLQYCRIEEKVFIKEKSSLERMMAKGNDEVATTSSSGKDPKIRAEFLPYEGWVRIASELIQFGDFIYARVMLNHAKQHAAYLTKTQEVGEIMMLLANISFLEGRHTDAVRSIMDAHRMIKSMDRWCESIEYTFRILKALDKWEDISKFLEKIMITLMDCRKNKKDFESIFLRIGWLWNHVQLFKSQFYLEKIQQDKTVDYSVLLSKSLKSFFENASIYGCLRSHVQLVYSFASRVSEILGSSRCIKKEQFKENYKLVKSVLSLLEKVQSLVNINLKYTFVSDEKDQAMRSPLLLDLNRVKLEIARLEILLGILKLKSTKLGINVKQIEQIEMAGEKETVSQTTLDLEKMLAELPERHAKYLLKLTRDMEKAVSGTTKRLDSFEKAYVIGKEVRSYMSNLGNQLDESDILILRSIRLKRKKEGKTESAWSKENDDSKSVDTEGEHFDESENNELVDVMIRTLDSLMKAVSKKNPSECYNIFLNPNALNNMKDTYFEAMQIYGDAEDTIELTVDALSGYQSSLSLGLLWRELENISRPDYRPRLLSQLLIEQIHKFGYLDEKILNELHSQYKILGLFQNRGKLQDIINTLRPQTAICIFQFNQMHDELYIGYIFKPTQGPTLYRIKRIKIDPAIVLFLDKYNREQSEINTTMFKTPFHLKEDLLSLEDSSESKLLSLLDEFKKEISPLFSYLDQFINQKPEKEDEPEETIPDVAKKDDKKQNRKVDNKQQLSQVVHDEDCSEGGVKYLTLLIDHQYITLPFEHLDLFASIPVVTKDYSVQVLWNRMRNFRDSQDEEELQFSTKMNQIKFISYDFKEFNVGEIEDVKSEPKEVPDSEFESKDKEGKDEDPATSRSKKQENDEVHLQMYAKESARLKLSNVLLDIGNGAIKGYSSSDVMPSIGDWMTAISTSNGLIYYGNNPITNTIKGSTMIDLGNTTNLRFLCVIDRINPLKKLIKKTLPIEKDLDPTPIAEYPRKTMILAAILGVSTSVLNIGNIEPSNNVDAIKLLLGEQVSDKKDIGRFTHEFRVSGIV